MPNSERTKREETPKLAGIHTAIIGSSTPVSFLTRQERQLMLLFIRSGCGSLQDASHASWNMEEHSFALLPLWRGWTVASPSFLTFEAIVFSHPDPEGLLNRFSAAEPLVHSIGNRKRIAQSIAQLLRSSPPLDQEKNNLKLRQLLFELEAECDRTASSPDSVPPYVQAMKDLIDTQYGKELSLDSIAAQLGKSKYYLSRAFSSCYHVSPGAYLTSVRLEQATQLLQNTRLPVKKISQQVGFPNDAYFISLFKKYYGLPPRQYRLAKLSQELEL